MGGTSSVQPEITSSPLLLPIHSYSASHSSEHILLVKNKYEKQISSDRVKIQIIRNKFQWKSLREVRCGLLYKLKFLELPYNQCFELCSDRLFISILFSSFSEVLMQQE